MPTLIHSKDNSNIVKVTYRHWGTFAYTCDPNDPSDTWFIWSMKGKGISTQSLCLLEEI